MGPGSYCAHTMSVLQWRDPELRNPQLYKGAASKAAQPWSPKETLSSLSRSAKKKKKKKFLLPPEGDTTNTLEKMLGNKSCHQTHRNTTESRSQHISEAKAHAFLATGKPTHIGAPRCCYLLLYALTFKTQHNAVERAYLEIKGLWVLYWFCLSLTTWPSPDLELHFSSLCVFICELGTVSLLAMFNLPVVRLKEHP